MDLIGDVMRDEYFSVLKDKIPDIMNPANYVGMCERQVLAFTFGGTCESVSVYFTVF